MGASESGPSVLARNWTPLDSHTYRNSITHQLIDKYTLECTDGEQASLMGQLCLQRSNINHPNIVKLVYYTSRVKQDACCQEEAALTLYLQHTERSLGQAASNIPEHGCMIEDQRRLCCGIMAGLGYLSEQYGFFRVTPDMIFVNKGNNSQMGQVRNSDKVWMHSDLRQPRAEMPCEEVQMATSIAELFTLMNRNNLCCKVQGAELGHIHSVSSQIQRVNQLYDSKPMASPSPAPRKKAVSAYVKPQTIIMPLLTQQSTLQSNFNRHNQSFTNILNLAPSQSRLLSPTSQSHSRVRKVTVSSPKAPRKISFTYPTQPPNQFHNSPTRTTNSPGFFKSVPQTSPQTRYNSKKQQQESPIVTSHQKTQHNTPVWRQAEQRTFRPIKEVPEIVKQAEGSAGMSEAPKSEGKKGMFTSEELEQKLRALGDSSQQKIPQLSQHNSESYCSQSEAVMDHVVESEMLSEHDQNKMTSFHSLQNSLPNQLDFQPHFSKKQSLSQQQNKGRDAPPRLQLSQPITVHQIPNPNSEQRPVSISSHEKSSFPKRESGLGSVFAANRKRKEMEQRNREMNENYNNYLQKFSQALKLQSSGNEKKKVQPKSFSSRGQVECGGSQEQRSRLPKTGSVKDYLRPRGSDQKGRAWRGVGNHLMLEASIGSIQDEQEQRKASLLQRIATTEKIIRQNRKKLEKIQLEKDLEKEKELIQQEMEMQRSGNMINEETNRIKQKVNQKREHFAELKAEATKILQDLYF